ncbi:MAG: PaaI family thioesterase [Ilumatobacteraceae bacterium]
MSLVTVDEVNAFLAADFGGTSNRCEELGEGWAVCVVTPGQESLRPGGIISGPTVFGACDAALYYACFTRIGIEPMVLTSELSIRYLRPARGEVLRARADLHQVGRRSIIGTVVAWTDSVDKPVAVAQGTYVRPVQQLT